MKSLLGELKQISWVVNSQAPGKGKNKPQHMIRYLSRYACKTAVSDKRIKKIENGNVHLSYIDRKKKKAKVEVLTEELFIKRQKCPFGFKIVKNDEFQVI